MESLIKEKFIWRGYKLDTESYGWTVECESPLELFHEKSNSRATGIAAGLVLMIYWRN